MKDGGGGHTDWKFATKQQSQGKCSHWQLVKKISFKITETTVKFSVLNWVCS